MRLAGPLLDQWFLSDRYTSVDPGFFEPFEIRLDDSGKLQRKRARGRYESHVASFLDETVDEDTVFWEIGAAWGYFSLMVARRASQVVSFEALESRVEMIRDSAARNGFDNVSTAQGKVTVETPLEDYPMPTVVLIDVEGWEYEVLRNLLGTFGPSMTVVVEVHDEVEGIDEPDTTEAIESYLVSSGFDVAPLKRWTRKNQHIVARPTGRDAV